MVWLAISGLLARRLASSLAALGLLTATTGFVLLVNTSKTTEAILTGDIRASWAAPYDILVRPAGSISGLERTDGLIRPNYLTAGRPGITLSQLGAIERIPGVAVAAPIAVVGFVRWPVGLPIDLSRYSIPGKITFFRITTDISAQAGLSKYPTQSQVLAVAPDGKLVVDPTREITVPGSSTRFLATNLLVGNEHYECPRTPQSCYAPLFCPSANQCLPNMPVQGLAAGTPGYFVDFAEPILMAGIDPEAEARLVGLDRCVVTGRDLTNQDRTSWEVAPGGRVAQRLPLIASSRSFIDESIRVQVSTSLTAPSTSGIAPSAAWTAVSDQRLSADDLYQSFLPKAGDGYQDLPFWSPGDVSYLQNGPLQLEAVPQGADTSIYTTFGGITDLAGFRQYLIPPEAQDVWLRNVAQHREIVAPNHSSSTLWKYDVVGQYDPTCLPGFSALSGGRLESYTVPAVRMPDGKQLNPTRSVGDYVSSPPLLLTTLDTALFFSNPKLFTGAPGDAFISEIRIRVAGTEQPTQAAIDRLRRIAAAIHDRTGLQVDIMRGSSAICYRRSSAREVRPPAFAAE